MLIFLIYRENKPKQTYQIFEADLEDALKDLEGADLAELADILGESTVQR